MNNPLPLKLRRGIIPNHRVSTFYGNDTELSDLKSLRDGMSPDSLNWLTGPEKDHIELRRGTALLGQTRVDGAGKVTGLGVGTRPDGTQVPFFSYGRVVKYYDLATDDTHETSLEGSTPVLPAAASGEDVSIFPYQNLAGAFVYLSSANSSIYKIPVANPGSAVDQLSTTYRGFLKFGQSRSTLINRHGDNGVTDYTGLYMSWVDRVSRANYTQITGEALGSSGSTSYSGTLAFKAAGSTRTCFGVVIKIGGTVKLIDNDNGSLVHTDGASAGSGTINYATGAWTVTLTSSASGALTSDYYWENASNHGVADFSFSGTRVAGEGRYFSQFDGGGPLNAIWPLANVFYGFHALKTWQTTIPTDDSDTGSVIPTNLPFRDKMGVSYPYSAFGTAQGIYYVNNSNPDRPEIYRLRLYTGATAANVAAPELISKALNLASYSFSYAVVFEWGIYVLVCFQQIRNGAADAFNSRMLVYNKKSGTWDLLDYPATRLAEYTGTLISGDPLSNNVFTLFSGFDDDGSLIPNYWTSGETNHGVEGQKKTHRMVVDGLIQTAQNIKVSIATDGGNFVEVFRIKGNGSYVDTGKSVAVGTYTVGSKIAGGGATVFANPFHVEFPLNTDRYEYIRIRFEASVKQDDDDPNDQSGGGYAQINYYEFKDIRYKGQRSMPSRIVSA